MKSLKKILIILAFFSFSNFLSAQDVPTVDDINKLEPKLPTKQESLPPEILKEEQSKKEGLKSDQLLKILVKDFTFDGNEKYSSDELKELLKEALNKELDYYQLVETTKIITRFYRSNGYLTTSYLPPQDINGGIIKIKITEAKLGTIIFDIEDEKKLNLSKEEIRKRILHKVENDGVLNIERLDKNVRNLNKIPGINALAQLEEGKNFGETNVKVTAINTETLF